MRLDLEPNTEQANKKPNTPWKRIAPIVELKWKRPPGDFIKKIKDPETKSTLPKDIPISRMTKVIKSFGSVPASPL